MRNLIASIIPLVKSSLHYLRIRYRQTIGDRRSYTR